MGQTYKRNYDRYTLDFKLLAVRLANHPEVMSKSIADSLGIHPIMLYRWQMEHRRGELTESKHIKEEASSPKRRTRSKPVAEKKYESDLIKANKQIKDLEKALANREEELDLLKKAQRFFAAKRKKSSSSSRRTGTNIK